MKEVVAVGPSDDDRPQDDSDHVCEQCGTVLLEHVLMGDPVFTEQTTEAGKPPNVVLGICCGAGWRDVGGRQFVFEVRDEVQCELAFEEVVCIVFAA